MSPPETDRLQEASTLESRFYADSQLYKMACEAIRATPSPLERQEAVINRLRYLKAVDGTLDRYNKIKPALP